MPTRRTRQSARHIVENFYDGASDDKSVLQLWAYTDRYSYEPGERVAFHVSTTAPRYEFRIFRDGTTPSVVHEQKGLEGEHHTTPEDCSIQGCHWPVAFELDIPDDWSSGMYLVQLVAEVDGNRVEHDHMFIVRSNSATQSAPLVLVCATGTWLAYNDWGGGSSYKNLDETIGHEVTPVLSTQRPWARGFCRLPEGAPRTVTDKAPPAGSVTRYPHKEWAYAHGYSVAYASAGWATYERHMWLWAEENSFEMDLVALHDLHENPQILDRYRCAVFVGHDEYWSWEMRDTVDRFVEAGGRVARFAGNFLWQVRMENAGKTQVCYKYIARRADPFMNGPDQQRVTNAWEAPEVDRPGALTFGVNATRGVYASFGHCVPRGPGGFTIYRPEHWAFEGAHLSYGDVLGGESRIFGYEVDGLDYTVRNGLVYPTGEEVIPEDLTVLGLGLASNTEADFGDWGDVLWIDDLDCAFIAETMYGSDTPENRDKVTRGNGMIVYFTKGAGEVFTAATCEWIMGLTRHDKQVERVTQNILRRFSAPS